MAFPNNPQDRKHSVALIVLGVLIIGAGITSCVLLSQVANYAIAYTEEQTHLNYRPAVTAWWYGTGYLAVGITACVAGATNARAAHITNVVFTSIALVVYGIWSIGLLFIEGLINEAPGTDTCEMSANCKAMYAYFHGLTAVICMEWLMILITHIIHDTRVCCRPAVPGAILHQGPTTTIISSSQSNQPYMRMEDNARPNMQPMQYPITTLSAQSNAFHNPYSVAVAAGYTTAPPAYSYETASKA